MKLPSNRWKFGENGLLLPQEFVPEPDHRLDEIVLRLPCFEPAGVHLMLSLRELLRHVAVIGSTGAGKTTLLNRAWSDLINYRSSTGQRIGLLILDSQGDHTAAQIRRMAEKAGRNDDVRVLSPVEGFLNPLSELTSFAAIDNVVAKIISATAFSSEALPDNREAYWTENTRNLLETALTYLLIYKRHIEIIEALQFISNVYLDHEWSKETEQIISHCDKIVSVESQLSVGIRAKLELAQNTVQSWKKFDGRTRGILQSCLRITLSPFLSTTTLRYWDSTKGNRIDPADALEGKIVVVSTRAATEVDTAALIYKLVKMDFYGAAQRRTGLGDKCVAGLVMDEFHYAVTTGSRVSDIGNLATLRSKGIFVIAATQGLIQLDLLLGVAQTEALLINFSNLVLMRSQEVGHLYHFAERVFGFKPARLIPNSRSEGSGDLTYAIPSLLLPAEAVCPPGALARLQTHQAFVSLADGFRTEEAVWLAPLYLDDPKTSPTVEFDRDLALLRRVQANLKRADATVETDRVYYSKQLWDFMVSAKPRQVRAREIMSLGEFEKILRGLGHKPDGLKSIPAAWRMACLRLARQLPHLVRLLSLSAKAGKPSVALLGWSGSNTSATELMAIESRWRRSLYPSRFRPLHLKDRLWLKRHFPHLISEMARTNKSKTPLP